MCKLTVTAIDTAGIQGYIFGSNMLKHNVGASHLVRCATQDWVYEELVALGPTNVDQKGSFNSPTIEKDDLVSELVYAGGGNTVILFRSQDIAREFARRLTRRALTEAPGLHLVVCHSEFDWDTQALSQVVKATLEKVSQKKRNPTVSAPLLGLGVTADCQYTGLPAVGKNRDDKRIKRISAEVQAKEDAFEAAHDALKQSLRLNGYEIPKDFDEFGRTVGESSYIGVIHTDGNGMGKRVAAIADRYPKPEDNRAYIQAIRAFSESVKQVAQEALIATYRQLIQSVNPEGKIGGIVPVRDRKLPLRPIVMGGDDVTFVCDGRLALTLTEFYLRQVTANPLADSKPLSARAGIAVVKSHFPFARAYALAEELTHSAKEYLKERKAPPFNEQDLSAMDWHFAVSGAVLDLQQVREREYTVPSGKLTMRPIRLDPSNNDWRSWATFTTIINDFRSDKWIERRNKIVALRDALREGGEAVQQYLQTYALPDLPAIPGESNSARTGWVGKRCTCYDAIEALEFFVPLEGGQQQ